MHPTLRILHCASYAAHPTLLGQCCLFFCALTYTCALFTSALMPETQPQCTQPPRPTTALVAAQYNAQAMLSGLTMRPARSAACNVFMPGGLSRAVFTSAPLNITMSPNAVYSVHCTAAGTFTQPTDIYIGAWPAWQPRTILDCACWQMHMPGWCSSRGSPD